ncbi:MAG: Na+/H+ antiporter subunit E [Sphingomonadales bacterium]
MLKSISLALGLFATWLIWSGHTDMFLIGLGLLSVALVVYLAARMSLLDDEGVPVHLTRNIFSYWGWLLIEIVKSNITVARIVLSPHMSISPTITKLKSLQTSDLTKAVFGNSIILTPGTLTTDIKDGMVTIHALTGEGARAVEEGEMNRRAGALDGTVKRVKKG